jgi:NarL family two-component system response regulator LiaR
MAPAIRILVADGDPLARRALVQRLEVEPGIEVAATAADAASAIAAVERLEIDVVLIDALLGDDDALATMRAMHAAAPSVAVLILSITDDHELGLRALQENAAGFLGKDVSLDALGRVVRSLARGEVVISRALTTELVERLRGLPDAGGGLRPVRSTLSTREWEVLDLMCAAATTQEIAHALELSPATVRSHVKRILRKLGVHSRSEAALRAREMLGRPG